MRKYYRRVWAKFKEDFLSSTGEQVIGALIVVGIVICQIRYGLIKTEDIKANFWSIAWPYVVLVVGFFVYHLVRAPKKLDDDRQLEVDTATNAHLEARAKLREHLERDDAPHLVLRWDYTDAMKRNPNLFPTLFRLLHLDNRSKTDDVFNIQIEPVYLVETVKAEFSSITTLEREQSMTVEPRFGNAFQGYRSVSPNDFTLVLLGAPVDNYATLPTDNYYRDAQKCDHLCVPVYISFEKYGGKRYRSKFVFDTNLVAHQDIVRFMEVKPIKPLS
jgi:hypothetical protein